MTCEAQQQSDQMVCKKCTMAWDVNDPNPPKCNFSCDNCSDKYKENGLKIPCTLIGCTPFDAIEKPWLILDGKHHYHKDKQGVLHDCWHNCKSLLTDWKFWVGMTFGFPFEHFLYEKVPPFCYLTEWLGL